MKRKLGLDFDDVLCDLSGGLARWHNRYHGTNYERKDIVSYHMRDLWGCTLEVQNRRIYEFYLSAEHASTEPVAGASLVLPMLEEQYEISVISARPESVRAQTTEWLEEHFPSLVDKLHLTNRFGVGPELKKSELCVRQGIEVFVDDAQVHHVDLLPVVPRVILFEAPWNREYALTIPRHQRVRSWYGLAMRLV